MPGPHPTRRRVLAATRVARFALLLAAPAAAADGWQPLLDASSIARWVQAGESEASFAFADGIVTGQPVGQEPKNAFLCSPRSYRDFELRFSFRIAPRQLNSGVQFRSRIRDDGIVAGPQLEMDVASPGDEGFVRRWIVPALIRFSHHPWRPRDRACGGVYGEALEFGWIYPGVAGGDPDAFAEQGRRLTRQEDWNDLRLDARGSRVRTWLNGELRADYDHEATASEGLLCLQVHGGRYDDPSRYRIEWRDLEIRER